MAESLEDMTPEEIEGIFLEVEKEEKVVPDFYAAPTKYSPGYLERIKRRISDEVFHYTGIELPW